MSSASLGQAFPFSSLPPDLQYDILLHLDLQTIVSATCCCKQWSELVQLNTSWKYRYACRSHRFSCACRFFRDFPDFVNTFPLPECERHTEEEEEFDQSNEEESEESLINSDEE